MSWLDTLGRSIMRAGPVGLFQGLVPGGQGERLLQGIFPGSISQPPRRSTRDFLLAYSQMPWLRAAVGKVSWSVGALEWKLYAVKSKRTGRYAENGTLRSLQKGRYETRLAARKAAKDDGELIEITEHPYLNVWDAADPYMTGLQLRQLVQCHIDLVGEAMLLKERNAMGAPIALWPIPPNWVISTPTITNPNFRVSWRGWQGWVPQTEILWLANLDPENPYGRGSGVSQALTDELDTDEFTSKTLRQFYFNRARPDLIVAAEGLSPEETRRMETDWLNRHQGLFRAFKPYFFGRKISVTEIGQDHRSQQMVQLREHERDVIIQVFGVPPEIVGVIENSNRATIDGATYIYALHVVQPRAELQRSIYQERLIPEYDDRLILDYESPVQEDRAFGLEQIKATPWAFKVDEIRAEAGKDPLDGQDGQVHMVPIGWSSTTSLVDLEPKPLPAPGTNPATPPPPPALRPAASRALLSPLRARAVENETAIDRLARRLAPAFRRQFLGAMAQVRGRVDVDNLARALDEGNLAAAEAILSMPTFGAELDNAVRSVLVEGFRRAALTAAAELQAVGVAVAFDTTNPHAIGWAEAASAQLVREVTEAERAAIRDLIAVAERGGLTARETAQALQRTVGLLRRQREAVLRFRDRLAGEGLDAGVVDRRTDKYAQAQLAQRAETIARTEIQSASYQGQYELWRQGVERGELDEEAIERVWIVHNDDRLDEKVCEPMDEQRQPWGRAFQAGDGRAVMMPPAHPRCRCAVVLDVKK